MIKLYSITGVLKDVLGDELKDISTFSCQENGGSGKMTLSLKYSKTLPDFQIGDIIKYYKNNNLIYSGNILEIEQEENVSFNFVKLNVIGLAHFIANYDMNHTYNDTLSNIVSDIISKYNVERGQTILSLGNIVSDVASYSIDIGEKNYLEYFKEVTKQSGYKFYISDSGEVNFGVGNSHSLTFAGDVESIVNIKTSDLISSQEIFNSIGIIVNLEYDYFNIKPLDNIRIQNNNKYKETYTVAKVSYGKEKATVELENFISFTKLLGN